MVLQDLQIFLSSSGALLRFAGETLLLSEEAKTGGEVPEGGPLMRRLSVMLPTHSTSRQGMGV